ncbi:GNAT family N-acetyltransferase [Citricoccus sp. GCM10030269]|uniref:GNAT family N-acetyltransferase n=1 Tax=Citricoccus sp. GCM10030269 TaxID=3273388 RepID=UPI003611D956
MLLETAGLSLRPWRISDAAIQRELWSGRDPRLPAARRISADGRPTVEELEERIRASEPPEQLGLLAVERQDSRDMIGYCGLVAGSAPEGELELAFELLRRTWGHGYATEASWAVIDWATRTGHRRLWATVWDWNVASRRVPSKLGFRETGNVEHDDVHGDKVCTVKHLIAESPV